MSTKTKKSGWEKMGLTPTMLSCLADLHEKNKAGKADGSGRVDVDQNCAAQTVTALASRGLIIQEGWWRRVAITRIGSVVAEDVVLQEALEVHMLHRMMFQPGSAHWGALLNHLERGAASEDEKAEAAVMRLGGGD